MEYGIVSERKSGGGVGSAVTDDPFSPVNVTTLVLFFLM